MVKTTKSKDRLTAVTGKLFTYVLLKVVSLALNRPDGFTLDWTNGIEPSNGYSVSLAVTQGSHDFAGLTRVVRYAISHRTCIGGWRDEHTNIWFWDATIVVNTLDEALTLGRANQQLAVFDLTNQNTIYLEEC